MADVGKPGRAVTVVSMLLAALFILNGGIKVAGMMVDQFAVWGYPAWFQYLIGGAEVLAGVGFLIRRTRFAASIAVAVIMVGAVYTLVRAGAAVQAVTPAAALLFALFVARRSRASAARGRFQRPVGR